VEAAPTDWRIRASVVAAFGAVLAALWWTGALGDVAEPERARALLARSGVAGPLLFVAAFALLQPFGLPGVTFMIPAALVWPPAVAIALCVAGAVGAGAFAFGLAHWIGPDAIVKRLPERLRRRTLEARASGFRTVLVVRLLFFLFPLAHWALGVSGIRFGAFLLGSALGFLPWMTAWILGTRLFADQVGRLPVWEVVGVAAVALVVGGAVVWWRRRRAG
jgi:uncharacterized membrane protein YdjX (TVP38/TMEM64 family)